MSGRLKKRQEERAMQNIGGKNEQKAGRNEKKKRINQTEEEK